MAKKTKPLPWIPLDENANPPFMIDLAGWRPKEKGGGYWLPVVLKEIKHTHTGKEFIFENQITKDTFSDFTYYLIVTEPEA